MYANITLGIERNKQKYGNHNTIRSFYNSIPI